MGAEVQVLFHALDGDFFVQEALDALLRLRVQLEAFVYSCTLFNVIGENSCTAKRRFQIEMGALRESYRRGELRKAGWILRRDTAEDVLIKEIFHKTRPCRN